MGKMIAITSLLVIGLAGAAAAQGRNSGDRALGTELNRDRAETRIERLREDQRQKEERSEPRAQKTPGSNATKQSRRAEQAFELECVAR